MWELLRAAESRQRKGSAITRDQAHRLLRECTEIEASRERLRLVRRIHSLLLFSGFASVEIFCNHLIRLFAASCCLLEASCALHALREPSAYTWSSIISAHGDLGFCRAAFRLYFQAFLCGFGTNKCVCLAAIKANTAPTSTLDYINLIHNAIVQNNDDLLSDVMIGNALIHVYTKCGIGSMEDARGVFRALPCRTDVSWNAMITACVRFGDMELAMICLQDMRRDGIIPNAISWATIIAGHNENGNDFIALDCYKSMILDQEVRLDRVIISSTLKVCASSGHLKEVWKPGRCNNCINEFPVKTSGSLECVNIWTCSMWRY